MIHGKGLLTSANSKLNPLRTKTTNRVLVVDIQQEACGSGRGTTIGVLKSAAQTAHAP